MLSQSSDNEKLENIGKRLIAAGALSEAEIDRIAARGDIFSEVLARIEVSRADEPFRFARFVRRHELGLGGALAAVIVIGVFGLYLQQRQPAIDDISRSVQVPAVMQPEARPENTPQVIVDGSTTGRAQVKVADQIEAQAPPVAERAVYRQPRNAASIRPQQASSGNTSEPEFYPVTYTGDNGESARGGRVIRVDLPRSTLFAMGMNVPLENESPTVKADILVGPDGVTRAIRLVE